MVWTGKCRIQAGQTSSRWALRVTDTCNVDGDRSGGAPHDAGQLLQTPSGACGREQMLPTLRMVHPQNACPHAGPGSSRHPHHSPTGCAGWDGPVQLHRVPPPHPVPYTGSGTPAKRHIPLPLRGQQFVSHRSLGCHCGVGNLEDGSPLARRMGGQRRMKMAPLAAAWNHGREQLQARMSRLSATGGIHGCHREVPSPPASPSGSRANWFRVAGVWCQAPSHLQHPRCWPG